MPDQPEREGTSDVGAAGASPPERNWWQVAAIVMAAGVIVAFGVLAFSSSDEGLEGEVWVVDQLIIDGTFKAPISGTILTAVFEDGVVNGVAGCNDYFGGYEEEDDTIEFTEPGLTRAFCNEPAGTMLQEIAYMALLQTADGFERDGNSLTLRDGNDPLIVFSAAPSD